MLPQHVRIWGLSPEHRDCTGWCFLSRHSIPNLWQQNYWRSIWCQTMLPGKKERWCTNSITIGLSWASHYLLVFVFMDSQIFHSGNETNIMFNHPHNLRIHSLEKTKYTLRQLDKWSDRNTSFLWWPWSMTSLQRLHPQSEWVYSVLRWLCWTQPH